MNPEKKVRKLLFKHLDMIQTAAVDSSKQFDLKAVPPQVLQECITRGKLMPSNDSEISDDFMRNYNKMLDDLYKNCIEFTKKMGAVNIPFKYLFQAVGVCKSAFVQGQEGEK